jgi:D-alanine transaminase
LSRIAYVNGRYLPLADAVVGIEDRSFQFADGVYEVAAVLNGRLLDWEAHLARLTRSCRELAMTAPMGDAPLGLVARRLLAANRARDALLYIQVSRGAAKRDHAVPSGLAPTLVMTVRSFDFTGRRAVVERGIAVATVADQRWLRPDIKSVSLLPNVLAKEAARARGATEAWLIGRDGLVTEGGSTNAWIVDADGVLRTRAADGAILAGVMRATLLRVAGETGLDVQQRAFTLAEVATAREAFITSTTNPCVPVVRVDDAAVGDGLPGPVARRLAGALWTEIARQTGWTG